MNLHPDRRSVLAGLGASVASLRVAVAQESAADLILTNGKITTLDRQNPASPALDPSPRLHLDAIGRCVDTGRR